MRPHAARKEHETVQKWRQADEKPVLQEVSQGLKIRWKRRDAPKTRKKPHRVVPSVLPDVGVDVVDSVTQSDQREQQNDEGGYTDEGEDETEDGRVEDSNERDDLDEGGVEGGGDRSAKALARGR